MFGEIEFDVGLPSNSLNWSCHCLIRSFSAFSLALLYFFLPLISFAIFLARADFLILIATLHWLQLCFLRFLCYIILFYLIHTREYILSVWEDFCISWWRICVFKFTFLTDKHRFPCLFTSFGFKGIIYLASSSFFACYLKIIISCICTHVCWFKLLDHVKSIFNLV